MRIIRHAPWLGAIALLPVLGGCVEQRATQSGQSTVTTATGSMVRPLPPPAIMANPMAPGLSGDRFEEVKANPWRAVQSEPSSSFGVDVNSASYALVRRLLRDGARVPRDAVRSEEMINYFAYDYPKPASRQQPFAVQATLVPTPWNDKTQLLHIGLQAYDLPAKERPRANLVFLIDVSGSMGSPDRLELVKTSLNELIGSLRPEDQVAIVTYAGTSGIALPATAGQDKATIRLAIDKLRAGGNTAGFDGLRTAYGIAEQLYDAKAVNRVILATDGDFNVGPNSPADLEQFADQARRKGIYLTVLGVGVGNLNDALMKRLARAGNGQAAYLDSTQEARKVLTAEMGSTMFPVADDVKIQVEFNPAQIAEYRLIGYEGRPMTRNEFSNDKVLSGHVGSGHSVTAIYEIMPVAHADPLRYQKPSRRKPSDEVAFVRLRYKLPGQSTSKLLERPVLASKALKRLDVASDDLRFSVAVAGYAQALRADSAIAWPFAAIAELAQGARGADLAGWRAEFVQLVQLAANRRP